MYPHSMGKRRIPGVAKMNRIDEDGVRIEPAPGAQRTQRDDELPLGSALETLEVLPLSLTARGRSEFCPSDRTARAETGPIATIGSQAMYEARFRPE